MVGFQTQNDLRAFHSGIEHLFGAEALRGDGRIRVGDRVMRAEVFPIGVDVDAVQNEAIEAIAGGVVQRMTDSLMGRALMMGVDRLDYSKGLVERFRPMSTFSKPIRRISAGSRTCRSRRCRAPTCART